MDGFISLPFVLDMSRLSDKQLSDFAHEIYVEQDKRLNAKIKANELPEPYLSELRLCKEGLKIEAIKQYCKRNNCDLRTAKAVIDHWSDKEKK